MNTHFKQLGFSLAVIFTLLPILLVGCVTDPNSEAFGIPPTISDIFETATPRATSTPRPTRTPLPTALPTVAPKTETIIIYEDNLREGWTPDNSEQTFYEFESTEFVYSGEYAIKVIPRLGFTFQEQALLSRFLITLTRESGQIYEKERIEKITFWLNPGGNSITPNDLAMAAQGSNDFTYWIEGDESARVFDDSATDFSEELLFFLGVESTVPPDTWVQVEYRPNELLFGTPYTYFTGFYMSNTSNFVQPYYIDQIEMTIVEPDPADGG